MPKLTEDTKKKLLDSSFNYEFFNLRFSFYKMLETGTHTLTGDINDFQNTALVDFLVHTKIFYEFFYGNPNSKSKAHAGHYIKSWEDKQPPKDIEEWKDRINIFLSPLSYVRVTEEYKRYPIDFLYEHFRGLVIDFLKELPEEYEIIGLKRLLENLKEDEQKG